MAKIAMTALPVAFYCENSISTIIANLAGLIVVIYFFLALGRLFVRNFEEK